MHTENPDQLDLFADLKPVPVGQRSDADCPSAGASCHVQPTFSEVSEEYKAFEAKFKPRKTTDDCYTPELVYNAVRDCVCSRYQIDPATIV
jgi:hypothetical protein